MSSSYDGSSSFVQPNNVYKKLENYNIDSLIGPPISPIVPSMQYITLPKEHDNFGYEALSHDYNGVGYYDINTAYGKSCTTFNLGKCPSNRVIPSGTAPAPAPAPAPMMIREGFQPSVEQAIRGMDITMYYDSKCPHSNQALKLLSQNKIVQYIRLKEVKDASVLEEAKKQNCVGVPFFVSHKTGKTFTGSPADLSSLISVLSGSVNPSSPQELIQKIKDLQITVFTMDGCIYCVKYHNLMKELGLVDVVTFKNIMHKDALDSLKHMTNEKPDGFPFTVSAKTLKSFKGYPSGGIADLLRQLS